MRFNFSALLKWIHNLRMQKSFPTVAKKVISKPTVPIVHYAPKTRIKQPTRGRGNRNG